MKILIVEDDADSRTYLERALKSQGYRVATAANGIEGLALAKEASPDLVISDILMPEMDGFELCRRMKMDEKLRALPFVFYTATYVDPKDERLALSLGASRFLIKPMELDDLLAAIKAVIDEQRSRTLQVPLEPLAGTKDLDRMQLEALARKLDKKVRDLEEEHEALLRSESRYRKILESMMDGFVYVDMDGKILEGNETYRQMLGYTDEELKSLTYRDLTPEKWHEFERKIFAEQTMKRGFSDIYQKEYRRKDGTLFPVELHTFLTRSKQGEDIGMWAVVRDITERKRAEHLLTGQKRVLEMIATNAPLDETLTVLMNYLERGSQGILASILLLDEDGVHVRHGAAPSLPDEYTRAVDGAEIGPSAGSCGTAMFRSEPVVVTDILKDPLWENYRHLVVPYGLLACWSTPILSHDGRTLGSFAMYYREVRSPTPEEKELVDIATHIASIAIEHNRTDEEIRRAARKLEESEERLQFATSAADVGTWHWDLTTKVHIWSDKCKELFGLPSDYPITYEAFLNAIHEDDRETVRDAVRKALREKTEYLIEMRVTVPEQGPRWLMSKGRGFYDEAERAVGMHGIVMDITERKIYEQELVEARTAAEAANRAKSQFLANMSHELRTPMAGVLGMLEITLGGALEEEQREFITTAHRSAGALVHVLNDILEMTKIEAGVLSLDEEPFVLGACVKDAVEIFDSEARHKGLDLILSLPGDLPERVVGDVLRLRQVMTNVVGNAVKFTERGRVEVIVAAGEITPSGRRNFTFTVKDTGIGIPEGKKHLVFRPFSQVDPSHTRKYGGTGLGLAISREIVERMGGVLVFECEEGRGCTFTFTVPLLEEGGPETAEARERA